MKSIFWKIFLSFWLVMLAVVSVTTILSLSVGGRWAEDVATDPWIAAENAMDVFEQGGLPALREWVLDPTQLPAGLTVYVVDSAGRDFLDREATDMRGRQWPPDDLDPLTARGGRTAFTLEDTDGTQYVGLVGRAQPQLLGVLAAPEIRRTVIPVALLASALACLVLSTYLTRPIARVVDAARKLQRGDYSQRAAITVDRADEIGELGRQFNAMAEQLERNETTRRELFRNLSHELRTPLARIQLAIELARRAPDDVEGHLDRMSNDALLLEKMTQQMLSLARGQFPNSGAADEIDVIEIVSLVVEDAGFEASSDNKTIDWSAPDDNATTHGNRDLFRSAIENVVRNAIQYAPPNSTVRVEGQVQGQQFRLRVSDEGPGVAASKLDEIFEPFSRADSEIAGVGIGLAITRQVIERMGGTVGAKNLQDGGFEIALTIPLGTA